jgi:integrase/recombinase XerD
MYERYFCARVVARLRAEPHTAYLEGFTVYLHRRGHSRLTVQTYVRAAEVFLRWLHRRRRPLNSITEDLVRAFAWRGRRARRPRANTHSALRLMLRHFRGAAIAPPRPINFSPAIIRVVADYDAHLRQAAGLAAATRLYRRRYAGEFLRAAFGVGPIRWNSLRPEHVHEFVAGYGRSGRAAAAQVSAGSLRSFLRWLRFRGLVPGNLIAAVPRFPRWRLTALPPVLPDDKLAALLATFDRSTLVGRRDFGMAVCLVDLGLRVNEVAGLELDDVDFVSGTLRLGGGKSRRDRILPMPRRVHQAILVYVRHGRPVTADRHVFVRHRVPAGIAVSRELVRGVIRRAYAAVPGCGELTGTHILRHTAASRLLRAGADLKRIADILGHQSIDTTAVYAKVDVDRLAAVAAPWPTAREVQP